VASVGGWWQLDYLQQFDLQHLDLPNCGLETDEQLDSRLRDGNRIAGRHRMSDSAITDHKPARKRRPIFWPQPHLRRMGIALSESGLIPPGIDCFKLARMAAEAAIRDEIDLLELSPKPMPVKPVAVVS
jgi:hypothetical protein